MTTIKEIRRANKAADGYFFNPDTMKTWNSLVYPEVYEGKGGVFFVTSERDEGALSRRFTVRQFHADTGRVTTPTVINEFRHHATLEKAQEIAAKLARSPELLAEPRPEPEEIPE